MMRVRLVLILLAVGAVVIPPGLDAQCNPATQRLIASRKYDDARADLEAQLKRAPGDDTAMECIGRLLLDQGESGDAVDWLEKAVAINAKNAQHHLSLGLALRAEAAKANMLRAPGLFGRMKTEYEQAVALDPALVDARYALLQILIQVPPAMGGSIAKAREHSAELLKLNPIRGRLGYALAAEQEKDFAGAEKEFLAAIAVRPDSDVAYGATGAFYRRRERWNDAIIMYAKQLKAMPKDATPARISNAHYFLGLAHEKNGHGDKAKAEYQAAIAANPKNEDAKKALAALKEEV
jgi:tetratricopeptide (TPR) repeat protein